MNDTSMENYRVFCDESCHLENDGEDNMVLGGLFVKESSYQKITDDIKRLKNEHKLNPEVKWTKLSRSRMPFYKALIDLFFNDDGVFFRAVVADKRGLDHERYNNGDHDIFYYKMFYYVLSHFVSINKSFRVFLDYKDTKSQERLIELESVLRNKFGQGLAVSLQNIRSHEVLLMQVTDLFIGAIGYRNRRLDSSEIKLELIEYIEGKIGQGLDRQSRLQEEKFNIFIPRLR
jgi:hypothetical protein